MDPGILKPKVSAAHGFASDNPITREAANGRKNPQINCCLR